MFFGSFIHSWKCGFIELVYFKKLSDWWVRILQYYDQCFIWRVLIVYVTKNRLDEILRKAAKNPPIDYLDQVSPEKDHREADRSGSREEDYPDSFQYSKPESDKRGVAVEVTSDNKKAEKLWKEYQKFYKKNDNLKAFSCLEKILLLEPNSYLALLREGDIFKEFERYNEALKCYKKCRRLDKKNGKAQNSCCLTFFLKYLDQ